MTEHELIAELLATLKLARKYVARHDDDLARMRPEARDTWSVLSKIDATIKKADIRSPGE